MWYHSPLRAIPLHKATQKGDNVEVAALLAQVLDDAMLVAYCALQKLTQRPLLSRELMLVQEMQREGLPCIMPSCGVTYILWTC